MDMYKKKLMQKWVDENSKFEPAFKTRVFNWLNKRCAEKKENLYFRVPQPSPVCDGVRVTMKWTQKECDRFFADGALPRDLTTIGQTEKTCYFWIFDATGAGGEIPEIELDPMPDFDKHPGFCAFDTDGAERVALVPSEFLKLVPTTGKNGRFDLKKGILAVKRGSLAAWFAVASGALFKWSSSHT